MQAENLTGTLQVLNHDELFGYAVYIPGMHEEMEAERLGLVGAEVAIVSARRLAAMERVAEKATALMEYEQEIRADLHLHTSSAGPLCFNLRTALAALDEGRTP